MTTSEWITREVTVDGVVAECKAHFQGWYSEGDAFGYGCEPPDGDEEITELIVNYAYDEETGEDVKVTNDLLDSLEIAMRCER